MPITPTYLNPGNFVYVKSAKSATANPATPPAVNLNGSQDLLRARSQLLRLFVAIEEVAERLNVSTKLRLDLPDAESSAGLGLDLSTTAATLDSSGEINASSHSFSPFGPAWSGSSSALLTIGGAYTGANGSGVLSFEARDSGTKGTNNLRIRVRDPQGSTISNINVNRNDAPGTEYSLQNGLFLKLGAGNLVQGDTATIQVLQNVGSRFDPSLPLGGIRNENPNFQYYPSPNTLAPIVNGSFLVNGVNVSVSPSDTMNELIARINQSAAGVTSSYNDVTERVEMVQNTTGSAATIVLQNDTSNLLVSAKLSGASVVPGVDPESQQALSSVAAFSAVQSGSILINGTPVAIDTGADSLETIIAKINASAAGVTAAFDTQSQRVLIEANDASSIFELDSNGTGLFAALNIPEGRVDPRADGSGVSRRRSYDIADAMEKMMTELNALFRDSSFESGASQARSFRSRLSSAAGDLFGSQSSATVSVFGLLFDRSEGATSNGRFAALERRDFTQHLQRRGEEVRALLTGRDDEVGLVGRLSLAALTALRDIDRQLGFSPTVIDTFA